MMHYDTPQYLHETAQQPFTVVRQHSAPAQHRTPGTTATYLLLLAGGCDRPRPEKLDSESQKVSQAITTVSQNVERFRALVQASGDRTCFTVLSELVLTGGGMMVNGSSGSSFTRPAAVVPTDRTSRNPLQVGIGRSHRYGQIPSSSHSTSLDG